MLILAGLLAFIQVEPFKIESKKITPEIRKEIATLDALRVDALTKALEAVGARLPGEHRILLKAVDAVVPDPAKFTLHKGFSAETSTLASGDVEIRFHVEYFVNGLLHPEETLRHEMVHAVMRLDLGKEKYGKLPKWLREGIAVHVAGQTARKLIYQLTLGEFAADPEKMMNGIEDAEHTLNDYPEDGLAIEHFLALAGADALSRLEEALRDGTPYREAMAALAKVSFDQFAAGAKERALKAVRELAERHKEELELFLVILKKNAESGAECGRMLKSFPKSPFRSATLYYRAKAAGDDALPHFEAFIASAREPGGMPGLIDEAMLRRARLFSKKNRQGDALAHYADIVKWHVGSGVADDALYEWGILLFPSDRAKAAPLLKRAVEIAPKHRLAERARKLLGE